MPFKFKALMNYSISYLEVFVLTLKEVSNERKIDSLLQNKNEIKFITAPIVSS